MFTLTKLFRFEASHVLPNHAGKCARLHGHSWIARVTLRGRSLQEHGPSTGMLADFGDLKAAVQPIVEAKLDHYHLNDSTGLHNPTSEALARWLFAEVEQALPVGLRDLLHEVVIEETCTSACSYRRDR